MKGMRAYNPQTLLNDGLLGQYSIGAQTGLLAAGTTGEIFQFRWQDDLRLAAVRKITIAAVTSDPYGAAPGSAPVFQLFRSGAWTVQGTGGAAVNTTTGSGKRRSIMGTSLTGNGDIRRATTAALGAGTKTLDTFPMASVAGVPVASNTGPVLAPFDLFDFEKATYDYPLVLSPLEGFSISIFTNPPTGTLIVSFAVDWWECHAS